MKERLEEARPVRSVQEALFRIYTKLIRERSYVRRVQLLVDFVVVAYPHLTPATQAEVDAAVKELRIPDIRVRQGYTQYYDDKVEVFTSKHTSTRSVVSPGLYDAFQESHFENLHLNLYYRVAPLLAPVVRDLQADGLFPKLDEGMMLPSPDLLEDHVAGD